MWRGIRTAAQPGLACQPITFKHRVTWRKLTNEMRFEMLLYKTFEFPRCGEMVAEDNEKKEIQFLQYDDFLQVITAIAGHVTTFNKSELENSILLVC